MVELLVEERWRAHFPQQELIGIKVIDSGMKGVRGGFDRANQRSFQVEQMGLPRLVCQQKHQEIKAWPE